VLEAETEAVLEAEGEGCRACTLWQAGLARVRAIFHVYLQSVLPDIESLWWYNACVIYKYYVQESLVFPI